MYQEFDVIAVNTDIKVKTISLSFSLDVDPSTVNDSTVQLLDVTTRNLVEYTMQVSGKDVVLVLTEWPVPNVEYILRVQDVKSILGEVISTAIRKRIIFQSSICSRLEITYPAENEVVSDLKVSWNEIVEPGTNPAINSYYIEISTENAFHNIVKKTEVVDRTYLDISDLTPEQYYIRGRVQKGDEYGLWSEPLTFIVPDPASVDPGTGYPYPDEPIYVQEISIVTTPENGVTPGSFMIEFDCDIDPDSIHDIIVVRRSI